MITNLTVLAAVDLSDLSPTVLDYASRFAMAWCTPLLVVHVVPDLAYFRGVYISDTPLPELQLSLESEAHEQLHTLCQTVLNDQVDYEMLVVTGRPVAEISRLTQERQVDCLVLGAHATEKPEHQLFGSTAERLLNLNPCPILMIPPKKSSYFISHGCPQ